MTVWTFAVTHWDSEEDPMMPRLREWRKRIDAFTDSAHVFFALGNTSDHGLCPCSVDGIADIGLPRTKPYHSRHDYFRSGLLSGLYYASFSRAWDVLLHVQDRTVIGEDLMPVLEEFSQRPEWLLAPEWNSFVMPEANPETGLFAIKRKGLLEYLTRNRRGCFDEKFTELVEEEFRSLLGNRWWNPWPEVKTTRFFDILGQEVPSSIITEEEFWKLPHISGGKHCLPEMEEKWKEEHAA